MEITGLHNSLKSSTTGLSMERKKKRKKKKKKKRERKRKRKRNFGLNFCRSGSGKLFLDRKYFSLENYMISIGPIQLLLPHRSGHRGYLNN